MTGRTVPPVARDDVRQVANVGGAEFAVQATRPNPDGGTLLGLAPWPDRFTDAARLRWVPASAVAYVRTLTPAGWVCEVSRPTD